MKNFKWNRKQNKEFSYCLWNIYWTVDMNIQINELMSLSHNFSINLVHSMTKIPHFSYKKVIYILIWRHTFICFEDKYNFSKMCIQKYMGKLRRDIIISLMCIFIVTAQKLLCLHYVIFIYIILYGILIKCSLCWNLLLFLLNPHIPGLDLAFSLSVQIYGQHGIVRRHRQV